VGKSLLVEAAFMGGVFRMVLITERWIYLRRPQVEAVLFLVMVGRFSYVYNLAVLYLKSP
jgi:hypothetical protein